MMQYAAFHFKEKAQSARGGVIVECLLVLPFLLLIFGGILGLGRAYAQLTWVANSAYEVALAGAGNPEGVQGLAAANERNELLGDLPYYRLVAAPTFDQNIYNQFPGVPDLENTVLVRMNAELPLLFHRWVTNLQVQTVLPILVLGTGSAGDLTRFQNASCLYNCNGDVIELSPNVCCTDPAQCPQTC